MQPSLCLLPFVLTPAPAPDTQTGCGGPASCGRAVLVYWRGILSMCRWSDLAQAAGVSLSICVLCLKSSKFEYPLAERAVNYKNGWKVEEISELAFPFSCVAGDLKASNVLF